MKTQFPDLGSGDLFTIGKGHTVYAKQSDGHYITVSPDRSGKPGDLVVGEEGEVNKLCLFDPQDLYEKFPADFANHDDPADVLKELLDRLYRWEH